MDISKEQRESLDSEKAKQFENRLVEHVRHVFPAEYADLGEEQLREEIQYGIDWAKRYGIILERYIAEYIDLQLTYGRDLDLDPEWVAVLEDSSLSEQEKLTQIRAKAGKRELADRGKQTSG